ncbi:MAG: hypothetical protein QXG00_05820 [Candidatus Woesearchaeota archaeon]
MNYLKTGKRIHKVVLFIYFFGGIFTLFFLILYGSDYYKLPVEDRVFHAKHQELKPSGIIGHGIGIIGSLMMILGVSSYMIRKRWRKLHRLGYLKHWLEFHIFLCSVGPILIMFHTAFKFGGIVSIGFWSMVIVVISGIIGRVIYIQLPKTLQGENLNKNEIDNMINNLLLKLDIDYQKKLLEIMDNSLDVDKSGYTKSNLEKNNFWSSIKKVFQENIKRRQKVKLLKTFIYSNEQLSSKLKKEYFKVSKTIITLKTKEFLINTLENLFRYWHIFHIPFAITMFVIMFIHIVITILFGAKWIF